ncbi:hypothetical protein IAD21_06330 [Abditibacteriota bacterium]|nr:hypothetical protein IAD21_06330 [Abditibacteriota bacterium]
MHRLHRVQIYSRTLQTARLTLVLLAGVQFFAVESLARAEDIGDLGTLEGTPSKPGGSKKMPRTRVPTPPRRPRSQPKTKPKSRPAQSATVPSSSVGGSKLAGTWQTTDGWLVHLKQTGTHVFGNFTGTGLSGTMDGKFNGKTYSGDFTYKQGALAFKGKMTLSYSPIDDRLKGNWNTGLYGESISAARISQ